MNVRPLYATDASGLAISKNSYVFAWKKNKTNIDYLRGNNEIYDCNNKI